MNQVQSLVYTDDIGATQHLQLGLPSPQQILNGRHITQTQGLVPPKFLPYLLNKLVSRLLCNVNIVTGYDVRTMGFWCAILWNCRYSEITLSCRPDLTVEPTIYLCIYLMDSIRTIDRWNEGLLLASTDRHPQLNCKRRHCTHFSRMGNKGSKTDRTGTRVNILKTYVRSNIKSEFRGLCAVRGDQDKGGLW